jgi:uncharacterized damage-inducible protein DinB
VKTTRTDWAKAFTSQARHLLLDVHLPRIERSLESLSEKDIWWRPNASSNSAGNLVLHLCGNVRQWIISGLGGAPDRRERDKEFAERGPVARRKLLRRLRATVKEASRVIHRLTRRDLLRAHAIQGFRVTGLDAVFHVSEHFSHHSGQILYITKMKRGKDLNFTRLPGAARPRRKSRSLPAV